MERRPSRDLDETRACLDQWLRRKLPEARDLTVSDLSSPSATGFSSDTLLFDLAWRENGKDRREALVVRTEPRGITVFPDYDIAQQFHVMGVLATANVPVPRTLWLEEDESILGAPFFVMARVDGRIPTDSPPYHVGGWMTEVTPAERAEIWWSGLEVLARIHRLDPYALGLGFLDMREAGATPLERQLAYYEHFLAWAAKGKPHPTCDPALAWLKANRPRAPEVTALCWGDARIGNMIFDGGRCVAVLDWEMATLGNPEQDLAWWMYLDRHHSEGCEAPRLPGFPTREETVARHEELTGRPAHHLKYYEVFAGFRFGVIMIRVAQGLIASGFLPPDSDFDVNNTATALLARVLDEVGAR
jgi:aminoglycoside phosphotransferase (APT) family kinase protein